MKKNELCTIPTPLAILSGTEPLFASNVCSGQYPLEQVNQDNCINYLSAIAVITLQNINKGIPTNDLAKLAFDLQKP